MGCTVVRESKRRGQGKGKRRITDGQSLCRVSTFLAYLVLVPTGHSPPPCHCAIGQATQTRTRLKHSLRHFLVPLERSVQRSCLAQEQAEGLATTSKRRDALSNRRSRQAMSAPGNEVGQADGDRTGREHVVE